MSHYFAKDNFKGATKELSAALGNSNYIISNHFIIISSFALVS